MDNKDKKAIQKAVKAMLTAKRQPKSSQHKQRRTSAGLWARPHHSDALGVNPDQIEQARASLRAQGVTADFDKDGRCIITSDKQFRQVAKACGLWDGAHGYGGGKDSEGRRAMTGREQEHRKAEFRRAIERGDYDL